MTPFLFLIVAKDLVGLVRQATNKQLYLDLRIGSREVLINLLQFVDDIIVIKSVPRCFELVAGLRVNFYKTKIGGIGIEKDTMEGFSIILIAVVCC